MYERDKLMLKGVALEKAANSNLMLPKNRAKGNHWKEAADDELLLMLDKEVVEFKEQMLYYNLAASEGSLRLAQSRLVLEAGDIINTIRFVCDKYDAI